MNWKYYLGIIPVVLIFLFVCIYDVTYFSTKLTSLKNSFTLSRLPAIDYNGPLFIAKRRKYTTHLCVGETFTDNAWHYRSCHFENLCYDGSEYNGTFIYYDKIGKSIPVSMTDIEHCVVALGSFGEFRKLPLEIRYNQEIPSEFYYEAENTTAIVFGEYSSGNFGHVIGDGLFPWFRILRLFDLLHQIPRPLRWRVYPPYTYACEYWLGYMLEECLKFYENLGSFFTGFHYKVLTFQEVYHHHKVCFPSVTSGINYLTEHGLDQNIHGRNTEENLINVGHGEEYWDFRNYVLQQGHVNLPKESIFDVLFREESTTHRWYTNFTDTVRNVQNRYPGRRIGQVRMELLNFTEQLRLVATAKVFISGAGGGSIIGWWAPKGSTVILVWTDNEALDGKRMEFYTWNNFPWIHMRWIVSRGDKLVFYNESDMQALIHDGLANFDIYPKS